MNRREFLKGTLGVGALAATSRLPVFAEGGNLFQKRGQYERLILNYVHIRIGLPKPFSVLHISDTHLTEAYPDEPKAKLEQRRDRMRCFGGRPLIRSGAKGAGGRSRDPRLYRFAQEGAASQGHPCGAPPFHDAGRFLADGSAVRRRRQLHVSRTGDFFHITNKQEKTR